MSRKPIKQSTITKRAAIAAKPTNRARKPQEPEIDFTAALPPASSPPAGQPPPTPQADPTAPYIDNNIYSLNEVVEKDNNLSSKDELLSLREVTGIDEKTELKPKEV